MPRFKGLIFDLDGVLTDSEGINIAAIERTFTTLGIRLSDEELQRIPGRSSVDVIPEILALRGRKDLDPPTVIAANRRNYDAIWSSEIKLMPDADLVIDRARDLGIPLGIGTTNRRSVVDRFIQHFGYQGVFSAIVTSESVAKKKPDPEVYTLCTQRLGFSGCDLIVVEDTEVGVMAAKNAGLACAVVRNRYSETHDFSRADYILTSIGGVLSFIC